MAAMIKSYISTLIILSLISKGFCQCSLNDINIGQARTERLVQGKPEWNVTVINNCSCSQGNITLACKGFQTVEKVDVAILLKIGDNCLLKNGQPLDGFATIKFSYAWDPPFLLLPVTSVIRCHARN